MRCGDNYPLRGGAGVKMERNDVKEIRTYFRDLDDALAVIAKLGAHVYDRSPAVLYHWDDTDNDWGAAFDAAMAIISKMNRRIKTRETASGVTVVSPESRRSDMLVRAYGAARRALQKE